MHGRRAEDPIPGLAKRDVRAASVDLRARVEEDAGAVPRGGGEHVFCSVDVREDALKRIVDDVANAHRGGEVIDERALSDELLDELFVEDAPLNETEVRVAGNVGQIPLRAGAEIV